MFKSCCARPNKKISKSKSKPENMDSLSESDITVTKGKLIDTYSMSKKDESNVMSVAGSSNILEKPGDGESINTTENFFDINQCQEALNDSINAEEGDNLGRILNKMELPKKRYSVDYKTSRINFKRFSVDCHRESATLEELARLEEELSRTNIDVRLGVRRKSTGILKSTTSSSNGVEEQKSVSKQELCSDDDEVFEGAVKTTETEGPKEPPATPVGRDELALRRHRFFSDLVCAARAAVEHRVRFDPLGPIVADSGMKYKLCNLFLKARLLNLTLNCQINPIKLF